MPESEGLHTKLCLSKVILNNPIYGVAFEMSVASLGGESCLRDVYLFHGRINHLSRAIHVRKYM